ncbi:MAG: AIM24 family protein [Alphaproteobacteria bacterium]|nr:AIM24 family protein [Alphaproteobacteria bacterium]
MTAPRLLPTSARKQTHAGITYHLDGELVPVLAIDVPSGRSVYFEHHILLWKTPALEITLRPMQGALKRMLAGMELFVTQTKGQGQIAFSRDGAGHIVPLHLRMGESLQVREHQFLAATDGVDYAYERVKGVANILFGGNDFFIDKFTCKTAEGVLWLHGYGNVFERVLAPGEQIDVEPGAWLYKDPSVGMETKLWKLSTGLLSAFTLTLNRFTGPGRVGLQSMYLHWPEDD